MDNYDKRSCYTCQYRGAFKIVNGLTKYECNNGIDIPAGKIFEFCNLYERKEKPTTLFDGIFGGIF